MDITEISVEKLWDAVDSVLAMKWQRYAQGDPGKMTQRAKRIRERLLRMYRYDPGK